MPQGMLPFQYKREKNEKGLTALGGAGLYLDLLKALRIGHWLDREVGKCRGEQGYSDGEIGQTLIMLNIVGGDCVEDLDVMESDNGFTRQYRTLVRRGRRFDLRFRRDTWRVLPSASSVFRYLERFSDDDEGTRGKATIPESVGQMSGFLRCNGRLLEQMQSWTGERTATLDQDATVIETDKSGALWGYTGHKAYQPLNVYWHELDLMVHTEFRPGNVPADYEVQRVFMEALGVLPRGVKQVYYRSDGAGYQHRFLKYLNAESGDDQAKKRIGRIGFAVSCPITEAFKAAVLADKEIEWRALDVDKEGKPLPWGREWAEVCYVPNELGRTKRGREYRYFMTRQVLEERALPGLDEQVELPFPVLEMERKRYKVFGVVSNREIGGDEIIRWHDGRCGKSEEAHAVLKNDLAGGKLPSGKFGANAVWWWYAVLGYNIQSIMKRECLGGLWRTKRIKAIRLHVIHMPGRIVSRSRALVVRLAISVEKLEWLLQVRRNIQALSRGPCVT
jgi:hypothetical protein